MMDFGEKFWNDRYILNQEGWDMKQVSSPIKEYIDTAVSDKNIQILIPGCGNAYEASYLLEKGFTDITLVDISSVLVERLKGKFRGNNSIKIIHSDIFDFYGQFDLMLEQTFFCTFPPARREEMVAHIQQLIKPGGKVAGVLFNENIGYHDHPPFPGNLAEYRNLFEPYYDIRILKECRNSIAPRKGNEIFMELVKK